MVRPEILGIRGVRRRLATPRDAEGADELFEALSGDRTDVVRGVMTSWYLGGRSLADIFDRPVRMAMERIGELWQHDTAGILREHQATLACVEAILDLRALLPTPGAAAPVAIGGAPEGDFYLIPTLMAATILRETGFRDRNYGSNTPLPLLGDAAHEHSARIVWVSISSELNLPLRRQLKRLAGDLVEIEADLMIGGRMSESHVPVVANARAMSSMAELAAFAEAARR